MNKNFRKIVVKLLCLGLLLTGSISIASQDGKAAGCEACVLVYTEGIGWWNACAQYGNLGNTAIPVECNVTQLRTRITRRVSQVSMSSVPLTGSVGLDFCDTLFLLGLIVKQGVRLLKETNT